VCFNRSSTWWFQRWKILSQRLHAAFQHNGNELDDGDVSTITPIIDASKISQKTIQVAEISKNNEPKKTVGTLPTKKKAGTKKQVLILL
jgi:hypothetical protein